MKSSSTSCRVIFLILGLLSFLFFLGVRSVWAMAGWQQEWDKVVKAAEKEGQLTIYAPPQIGDSVIILRAFQEKYPSIKLNLLVIQRQPPRVMAERRAHKYLVDLIWTSPSRLYDAFHRPKLIEPVAPALILPEVTDLSKWWQDRHHYVDPERRYVFLFESSIYSAPIYYNTKLVNIQEIKSIWDVLQPKWKGKIAAYDVAAGRGGNYINFVYRHPQMGPEFLKKLYTQMDVTLFRDHRQGADWLSTGKVSLCFHCRAVSVAKRQGLPVDEIPPYHLKETPGIGGGNGAIVRMKNAPHPNAGKVFINWLLSREGQITFRRANTMYERKGSMRTDLPSDVLPKFRRKDDMEHLFVNRHDWVDYGALVKFFRKLTRGK